MSDGSGSAPQLDEKALEAARNEYDSVLAVVDDVRWADAKLAALRAAVGAYLAASSGAGELDLTDEEIRALFKWLNAGSAGVTATESEVVFYQSARSKLRARLDRKDDE
jgi:hypothetical protein